MIKNKIILIIAAFAMMSCTPIYKKMNVEKQTFENLGNGLYANLQTSKGNMIVKLEDKKSPSILAPVIASIIKTVEIGPPSGKFVPYIFQCSSMDAVATISFEESSISDISKVHFTGVNICEKVNCEINNRDTIKPIIFLIQYYFITLVILP